MREKDIGTWKIITGPDVKVQAKRQLFGDFGNFVQFDAVLLVPKAADAPTWIVVKGTIDCHGCGKPFQSTFKAYRGGGSGTGYLACPNCSSQIKFGCWGARKLDGELSKFANIPERVSWITVEPWTDPVGSPPRGIAIRISEIEKDKEREPAVTVTQVKVRQTLVTEYEVSNIEVQEQDDP